MNFGSTYIQTVKADLFRYANSADCFAFIKSYILYPEFRYIFWMRTASYWAGKWLFGIPFHILSRFFLIRLRNKFHINIPYNTRIGPGLYIGHWGGIVVHYKARIGNNCNISLGVVIGESFRGERKGVPCLGDRVYIGPGAKLFGKIRIGNDVAIGANSVVTRDVPDHSVVVGIPGRVISRNGSSEYISNTYPKLVRDL